MGINLAIYKTPNQAEQLGTTIQKVVYLSESEARKIRDFYNTAANSTVNGLGTILGIVVSVLLSGTATAFGITVSAVAGYITNQTVDAYYRGLASKFDMITSDNPTRCVITYKYHRHGSNDGAYWIDDIKIK